MTWLFKSWNHFWFSEGSPTNLAACRITFFAALLLIFNSHDLSHWSHMGEGSWFPLPFFELFGLSVLPAEQARWLGFTWKVSLVPSSIGLATKLSTSVSFLLSIYVLGLHNNFGKTEHATAIVIFILGVFAFSRCGDSLSVDRALRRFFAPGDVDNLNVKGSEYTWPIRISQTLFMMVFFLAGCAKLYNSGLRWAFSDNMQNLLILHHYTSFPPPVDWGLLLSRYGWLCQAMAASALFCELSAPLALFSRKIRIVVIPGLFGMVLGIWLLLGIVFHTFFACFLFWIDWDRLGTSLNRIRRNSPI